MRKVNFNSLKNLQIPDAWTKKAIAISGNNEGPKKIPFVISRKVLSLVACLVVVCLVSSIPLIFKINNDILPVSTENSENISVTVSREDDNNPAKIEKEHKEKPTKEDTENHVVIENTEPSELVEETKTPSSNSSAEEKPEESKKPTQKPSETVPEEPVKTEPVEDFGPSGDNVINPDSPEDSSDTPKPGDCVVGFSPSFLVGDGKIYCRIYDKDDNILGNQNLFSDEHRASFYSGFGSVYYYIYSPSKVGLNLEPGKYRYVFYNEHTVPICNVTVVVE